MVFSSVFPPQPIPEFISGCFSGTKPDPDIQEKVALFAAQKTKEMYQTVDLHAASYSFKKNINEENKQSVQVFFPFRTKAKRQ